MKKTLLVFFALASCTTSPGTGSGFDSGDLAGACENLRLSVLAVQARCSATLPDLVETCVSFGPDLSCEIARCAWRLSTSPCDRFDSLEPQSTLDQIEACDLFSGSW